jgi:small subunit ribosomal protein S20
VANIKSAIKRVSIAERNRLRNKAYKSAVKTLTKRFMSSVEAYVSNPQPEQLEAVQQSMSAAYSKIDKAVKTGVLHRNCGARKKSQIAKALQRNLAPAS